MTIGASRVVKPPDLGMVANSTNIDKMVFDSVNAEIDTPLQKIAMTGC
jgi:hypothetical protein